ncbi:MAG: DUF4390 domain-containing protein [Betaproteobacteria bacterium]
MASFTHCWKSARLSLALLLAALLLCPVATQAQPAPAEIVQFRLEHSDEGVFLSAQMKFELSSAVQVALQKGITVYFVAEAQLLRNRWYWTDKKLATATRHTRLNYLPLTRRWRIIATHGAAAGSSSGMTLNQEFESLEEALSALSRLSHWKIAEAADVDPEVHHNVDFGFRLDLSALPRPFQIGILGQTEWAVSVSKNQRLEPEAAK